MVKLTFAKLRLWNLGVGLFQLVCAAIIFGITDYDLTTPWYVFFIRSREPTVGSGANERSNPNFFVPQSNNKQADVPVRIHFSQHSVALNRKIGVFSGIFLLLSGIDHLATVLPGLNKLYNRELRSNRNPFRWIEYSRLYLCALLLRTLTAVLRAVSASLMRVQIGMLSGIVDLHTLFGIFMLTATTMLFGWQMETLNGRRLPCYDADGHPEVDHDSGFHNGNLKSTRVNWQPFLFGFVPHFSAWAIVACHFFRNAAQGGDTPGFVWAIIVIIFTLDLLFAVVQFLQFKQARFFRGFARAEFAYIILSLTSKQLLAWIEFGGSFSLSED